MIPTGQTFEPPRVIAVVLPQFHPIAENDMWWGKGFTEWTNVAKARPLFPGHYQPRLPGELGFYDLRLSEVRLQQAALAREHGIGGFCYYHYWFNGRRLLHRPFDEVLSSGNPDMPFCLCWANENWSRAWNGSDREVLIEQNYGAEDDEAHFQWLAPVLADPRCIRVGGKPLFIIYRVDRLPEPRKTFELWRTMALRQGIGEICLAHFEAAGAGSVGKPADYGLDLAIEFSPDWRRIGGQYYVTPKAKLAISLGLLPKAYREHRICDYERMVERAIQKPNPDYRYLRCVAPGFDNSARRAKGATVLVNSSPEAFGHWMRSMLDWTKTNNSGDDQILFVNAWNEWAEGNHLEPDARNGRAYLVAAQSAMDSHITAHQHFAADGRQP